MKKILFVIILNFFIISLFLIILPSFFIQKRQGTSIGNSTNLISFVQDKPINFSFFSTYSNLNSLTIDLKNPLVLNNSQINFKIIGPNSQREILFYGNNVGDPSSVPLKFNPFSDPPKTKYLVNLTTTNTDHSGLYLVADKNNSPLFNSYYLQSNFKQNVFLNFYRQLNLFQQRSLVHNIIYLSLIIYLNFLVIKFIK